MKLVEHYIMRGTRRLVLIIVGFLIFIFASYSAQRYLTEAANGGNDSNLLIVFYVQIMPDDFVMQLHRF